jgi:hypothetical protein
VKFEFLGALPWMAGLPYPTAGLKIDDVINPGYKLRVVV